tara:strand:+ start:4632 stop:5219 length:588 start_codon:yes stop_codon:yes gene_type:complete
MPFITINEIIDIIIMTLFVGYIFSGYMSRYKPQTEDPLVSLQKQKSFMGVSVEDLKFTTLVTAPAIILHEFAHKLTAIAFGFQASFNAAYFWLILGVALKLFGASFFFFIPAYASILGNPPPLQSALIAVAGPLTNAVLWLLASQALKKQVFSKKYNAALYLTSKVNMFLFIFNMLPFFFFDGFKFFQGIFHAFF